MQFELLDRYNYNKTNLGRFFAKKIIINKKAPIVASTQDNDKIKSLFNLLYYIPICLPLKSYIRVSQRKERKSA